MPSYRRRPGNSESLGANRWVDFCNSGINLVAEESVNEVYGMLRLPPRSPINTVRTRHRAHRMLRELKGIRIRPLMNSASEMNVQKKLRPGGRTRDDLLTKGNKRLLREGTGGDQGGLLLLPDGQWWCA